VFKEIRRHGIAQISEGLNRDWQAGEEWCAPFGLVTKRKNGSSGWHPASVSALLHDIRVMGLVQRTVTDQRTGEKRKEGEPYRHPLHEAAPAWVRTACVSSDALARSVDRCLGVETRLAPARHPETSNRWSGRTTPRTTASRLGRGWLATRGRVSVLAADAASPQTVLNPPSRQPSGRCSRSAGRASHIR
jgi:hypothetical protein